jgi:hypothetical protein
MGSRCVRAVLVVALALGVTQPAVADPGDAASGHLTRTSDGKVALTAKNDGTTTLHYLRLDLASGYAPAGPTMSGGTCGAGATSNQFACSGFSLAPGGTVVVTFDTAPKPYPDNAGGTLHVSSGGASDATSAVGGPDAASGGGTVDSHCRISIRKSMVTREHFFKGGYFDIEGIAKMGPSEYALEKGLTVEFVIVVEEISGPCPELHLTDLLPSNFRAGAGSGELTRFGPAVPHESLDVEFNQTNAGERANLTMPATGNGGGQGVWTIKGEFVKRGDQVNQVSLVSPGTGTSNRVQLHVVTDEQVEKLRASATKVEGEVGDAEGDRNVAAAADRSAALSRVKRVDVAIRRVRGRRCLWLRDRRAHFKRTKRVGRYCAPVWLKARGTRRWALRLRRRLPRGRYVVVARVVDRAGVRSHGTHGLRLRVRG